MKKWMSLVALLLAMCMALGMMTACSSDSKSKKDDDEEEEETTVTTKADDEKEGDKKQEEEDDKVETADRNKVNDGWLEYMATEKVGMIHRDDFQTAAGGLYYKENDKYGIISYEGLFDTGAVYAFCETSGAYFSVSKTSPTSSVDYAGINSRGLIDGNGKQLVPAKYADFRVLNDRFVQAYTVTSVVADNADYLVSEYFSDGTKHYAGTWCIYDITTGKEVPGISGTKETYPDAHGNYVKYHDEDYTTYVVDGNGKPLAGVSNLFEDGSYNIEGKIGEMFDADGKKLFAYDLVGFVPTQKCGDYYLARQYTTDGGAKYVVMDTTGKVVSAEYSDYITVYGNLVLCGDKLYNLKGDVVYSDKCSSVYVDDIFGKVYFVYGDDKYTMIDEKGNVFFSQKSGDKYGIFADQFVMGKKNEESYGYNYYSHKDQDYTIDGTSFITWLIKTEAPNYRYDLVDSITGKKLFEGYKSYSYAKCDESSYYVYAEYDGGAEVYLVISSANLGNVTQKKEDLFNDLSNAFSKEGIAANVNKETGEITLDTSVLFGGDSAELTAEGKAFLDKFIKVYTDIAFSTKYTGFITKTMVEGHTAPVEGTSYAMDLPLSEDRANNVLNYCLTAATGIDAKTFEAIGYSNSRPVYDAAGNVDMDASRRVSFRFLINVDFVS